MNDNEPTYINFTKEGIKYAFHARFIVEENKMYSWYIPAFKMFFSTKTEEEGEKRAIAMTKSFFKFWKEEDSFRGLLHEINYLGFKATHYHDLTMNRMLKGQLNHAKFKAGEDYIPEDFIGSKSVLHEGELAMTM
jgi:hypothetical protein